MEVGKNCRRLCQIKNLYTRITSLSLSGANSSKMDSKSSIEKHNVGYVMSSSRPFSPDRNECREILAYTFYQTFQRRTFDFLLIYIVQNSICKSHVDSEKSNTIHLQLYFSNVHVHVDLVQTACEIFLGKETFHQMSGQQFMKNIHAIFFSKFATLEGPFVYTLHM